MGTRMSGWVFRQNDRIEMQMKNTETTPMVWNLKMIINKSSSLHFKVSIKTSTIHKMINVLICFDMHSLKIKIDATRYMYSQSTFVIT